MPLDLPSGSSCFIDANIFYYAFVQTPDLSDPCSDLLERAGSGEVRAFTSMHVLAEATHKVMMTELCTRMGISRAGAVRWAQQNSPRLRELQQHREFVSDVTGMDIPVLPLDLQALAASGEVSTEYGLLTNDALIIALMKRHGLAHLVTNDDD